MKNRKIQVHLFGALGERTTAVSTRGGFPTRHIKVPADALSGNTPTEPKPPLKSSDQNEAVLQSPVNPTSDTFPETPTLFEVLRWMEASDNHSSWLIIDEILFVATAHYKMEFNQDTLLNALRLLYQKGGLEYRLNRFNQHTFRLIENQTPDLKALLAEVDAVMGEGGSGL